MPSPPRRRCPWTGENPLLIRYHDTEWGKPVHNDRRLFEMLTLEGAQAGLSWLTILKKRAHYRRAFDRFDVRKVSRYNARKIRALLADPGIVRNRLKVESTVANARAFLAVQKEFGSFDAYLWTFVEGKQVRSRYRTLKELPPRTPLSDALSKDLKKRGFRFAGSTICYAFLQATGVVDDHLATCFLGRGPARGGGTAPETARSLRKA